MTKKQRKREQEIEFLQQVGHGIINEVRELAPPPREPLRPRTLAQGRFVKAIRNNTLVVATGPAGTGKSYVCAAMAADALREGQIDRLILTRPSVEAGESLGFLPGKLEDKYRPYMDPFYDVLEERLGRGFLQYLLKAERIQPIPLGYMRGRTFRRTWVILDEAQNTTVKQMMMFLTRIGEDSKVIVNGDMAQTDIHQASGLEDAVKRLAGIPGYAAVHFTRGDVVRSDIVQHILRAYDGESWQGYRHEAMALAQV